MMRGSYPTEPWLSPKVEVHSSGIHGKGMFSKVSISQGEIVVIWGGKYVSKSQADRARMSNPVLRVQQIDDDVFEVFSKETAGTDPTYFQNHSCDPNTWMEDEVTISARRNIQVGEELTIDYAMFEANESYVVTESCVCAAPICRKRITGGDWRLPELQKRYGNHFSPLINRRIAKFHASGAVPAQR